ncbi:carboxypeptidase regulatory-like domain-containing protein [Candidatus Uhrbacteria bacterium]|nr:carboxypeptidase regulatory-like domain-containing protein [Candidatus Uhrbacteria bacterium]
MMDDRLPSVQPRFFTAGGTLELTPDAEGRLGVGVGASVLVQVSLVDLGSIPSRGTIAVGDDIYALTTTPAGDAWAASFTVNRLGPVSTAVSLVFANEQTALANRVLLAQGYGHVREKALIKTSDRPIPQTSVSIYERETLVVTRLTNAEGVYGVALPNGRYRVVYSKDGYQSLEQTISVQHQWLGEDVTLTPIPKKLAEIIDPNRPLRENVKAIFENVAPALQNTIETIQSPQAQAVANTVLVPTAVTVVAANTATAASAFHLINYLQFLFTQPLLLIHRRKRKKWGVVYNALSKKPVDLAIVRLIHSEKNMVVQTRITDMQGRFSFNARPGTYRVDVQKPGYLFPSTFLKDKKTDVDFLDLYHGEPIEVKESGVPTFNIPADPNTPEEPPKKILYKKTLRHVQNVVGWASVGVTGIALVINPSWLMVGFMAGQVLLHLVFRRLAVPRRPKDWGIVYDGASKLTLGQVIVRIFDKKFNKLLETQVTEKNGKYGFFVGKNVYYVTAEHAGYQKYVSSEVDLTQKEEGIIDQKILLQRPSQ